MAGLFCGEFDLQGVTGNVTEIHRKAFASKEIYILAERPGSLGWYWHCTLARYPICPISTPCWVYFAHPAQQRRVKVVF